jgi:hypothetical protein
VRVAAPWSTRHLRPPHRGVWMQVARVREHPRGLWGAENRIMRLSWRFTDRSNRSTGCAPGLNQAIMTRIPGTVCLFSGLDQCLGKQAAFGDIGVVDPSSTATSSGASGWRRSKGPGAWIMNR